MNTLTIQEIDVPADKRLNFLVPKPLKTAKEGRTCKYPECITILSIYNFGRYCRAHQAKVTMERENILIEKLGLDPNNFQDAEEAI